mgnify:FL=1
MEGPLVSVITITRNRGSMIGRCIKSVLGQTYQNFEHIIVDGASNDNTDDVIASIKDPRLRYIKLDSNWPIPETINKGIKLSKGQFITFLDSDDEYLPAKIEKQLAKMQTLSEEYGMVYCWMTYYNQKTMEVIRIHNPQLKGDVSEDVVEKPTVSGTPTLFFRRGNFLENGGWKDTDEIGIISDWEMCARFCQKWKVDFVPESLVNVYINHGATRMSENRYHENLLMKQVKFEKYFLSEFSNIFNKYPKKSFPHLYSLSRALMIIGRYSEAWPYYMNLVKHRHSIKDMLLLPYSIIKKWKYGVTNLVGTRS